VPPNSSDQVQKCHEAVPGILRCACELVYHHNQIQKLRLVLTVAVWLKWWRRTAWHKHGFLISTWYSLSISNSTARKAKLWSHC
jgi:hypothetical protein